MSLTTEALDRLAGQFQESPKLRGMLEAIIGPLDTVLADIDSLKNERWIDTALGQQLDGCGQIVGEPRQGRDDDEYRAAIKYRVFVNVSNGTPDDMQQALAFLVGGDDKQYIEAYPATAMIFSDGAPGSYKQLFSRASTATYVDAGIVKYAAIDEKRFENGEALIEIKSTNLLTYSEQLNNASWTKASTIVSANAALAPDGSNTAEKIVGTATFGTVRQSFTSSDNTVYTASVFAKAAEYNSIRIAIVTKTNVITSAVANLSTKTIVALGGTPLTFSLVELAGSWFRVNVSANVLIGVNSTLVFIYPLQNGNANTPGDGTSGIFIWGAQLESGQLSSYIPTVATAVTRAADRIYYEKNPLALSSIQSQIQDIAPAGISDVPVMVSYTQKPFRFGRASLPGELFVNDQYLTANGSDLQVNTGQNIINGSTLGGLVPSDLTANGSLIELSNGSFLVVNSPNHDIPLDSGYHLAGVFQ